MRLADKVATMARRGAPLPYDAEVEWISGDGIGSYINTGIYPDRYTDVRVGYIYDVNYSGVFFGVDNGWKGSMTYFHFFNNFGGDDTTDPCIWSCFGNKSVKVGYFYPRRDGELSVINGVFSYDGKIIDNSSAPYFKSNFQMPIFAHIRNGNFSEFRKFKCPYFKIYQNGGLVIDFIPVRFTNENGISEGAMYDRVSGQLFRNQGTGAFIIGPDK